MPPWDNTSGKRPHTGTAAVGLNCLRRHPTEVGVGPARTLEIPLKSAAGAEADPAIVAALFERVIRTPQLSQRLGGCQELSPYRQRAPIRGRRSRGLGVSELTPSP